MADSDNKVVKGREYSRKYHEARTAEGAVKTTVWLEPAAAKALDEVVKATGEKKGEVLNRAMLVLIEKVREELKDALRAAGE